MNDLHFEQTWNLLFQFLDATRRAADSQNSKIDIISRRSSVGDSLSTVEFLTSVCRPTLRPNAGDIRLRKTTKHYSTTSIADTFKWNYIFSRQSTLNVECTILSHRCCIFWPAFVCCSFQILVQICFFTAATNTAPASTTTIMSRLDLSNCKQSK